MNTSQLPENGKGAEGGKPDARRGSLWEPLKALALSIISMALLLLLLRFAGCSF